MTKQRDKNPRKTTPTSVRLKFSELVGPATSAYRQITCVATINQKLNLGVLQSPQDLVG